MKEELSCLKICVNSPSPVLSEVLSIVEGHRRVSLANLCAFCGHILLCLRVLVSKILLSCPKISAPSAFSAVNSFIRFLVDFYLKIC